MYQKKAQSGIAALLTVVIVTAAALIFAFSSVVTGIGELEIGFTAQQGEMAFSVADGCAEETLRRMRLNANYGIGATINLTVLNGSCTIDVTDLGENRRRVSVVGTTGNFYKRLTLDVSIAAGDVLTVDSWKEVSN